MKYIVTVNGKKFEVEVEREEGGSRKSLTRSSSAAPATPAPVAKVVVEEKVKTPVKPTASANDNSVVSPLPGSVFDIKVKEGDTVKYGQVLIILEAMKMETEIVAPADGVVKSVLVNKGDSVDTDTPLVILN
ncbi:MAG: biotin/lipoyl-binding protein [Fusobacteriaceae bacterium]|jgi:biotin carboxyl carrier protein|nr:biotin/lipoyl-binding protein [Fusobacteriaceae bacterium]